MNVKIYTTAEVRSILRISKGEVFKLIHNGEIEYFRIGRAIRITETALNDYITAHSRRKEDK